MLIAAPLPLSINIRYVFCQFRSELGLCVASDAYARQTISSEAAAAAPAPEKTAKSPNGGASLRRFAALEGFVKSLEVRRKRGVGKGLL